MYSFIICLANSIDSHPLLQQVFRVFSHGCTFFQIAQTFWAELTQLGLQVKTWIGEKSENYSHTNHTYCMIMISTINENQNLENEVSISFITKSWNFNHGNLFYGKEQFSPLLCVRQTLTVVLSFSKANTNGIQVSKFLDYVQYRLFLHEHGRILKNFQNFECSSHVKD